MRAIFISYRREDTEGQAGRLFNDLAHHFGEQAVFMDVAGIEAGRDFRKAIDEHVSSCGVLLALIGKSWTDAKDPHGQRRLDDPLDFVRLETASALKRDIPVVPVLVQGAHMPRADQLPADLSELAFRNAIELTHARWESDLSVLVKALSPYVTPKKPVVEPRRNKIPLLALAVAVIALATGGYFLKMGDRQGEPLLAVQPSAEPVKNALATTGEGAPAGSAGETRDSASTTSTSHEATTTTSDAGQAKPIDAGADTQRDDSREQDEGPAHDDGDEETSLPIVPAPLPVVPEPQPNANATHSNGTMLFYRYGGTSTGAPDWRVAGEGIGTGWTFKQVFAGDGGAIYAIQDDGKMLFYRHGGMANGTPDWPIAGKEIGTGWNFKQVFAGGGGAIYAIQDDGKMLFYRHGGMANGTPDWPIAGKEIGTGWNFKQVFAGGGGAIYAIQDDGKMLFYRHGGMANGTPDWPIAGKEIGTGWNFKQVFAGGGGAIYAIQDDGKMLFYRHGGMANGTPDWPIAGKEIGTGWNFKQVFAGDDDAIYAIE